MADCVLVSFTFPAPSSSTSRCLFFPSAKARRRRYFLSPGINCPELHGMPCFDRNRQLLAVAQNFRRPAVETGAGRSKAKRRGSGGRIEGPGHIARPKPYKLAGQKTQKAKVEEKKRHVEDPNTRHPDEYYKYGPYGPYGKRAQVIGKPKEATFGNAIGSTFSPVKNDEEFEERARRDAAAQYLKNRHSFDESVGVQYFFAFVRRTRNLGSEVPWKEWTLVAHVAVESGEELDKWTLDMRLPRKMRNTISQCAAWFRPDLIYVKKPIYQLRFEPVQEFVDALAELVLPSEYYSTEERDSYYRTFCEILGLDLHASADIACSTYNALDKERQLTCLEHLLCNNPVELLHPFTRPRMEEDRRQKSAKLIDKVEFAYVDEDFSSDQASDSRELSDNELEKEDDEGWGNEEESDEEGKEWFDGKEDFLIDESTEDIDEAKWHEKMKGLSEKEDDMLGESESRDEVILDEEDVNESPQGSELRAAVRPYTYRDLVKEVVLIRQALLTQESASIAAP